MGGGRGAGGGGMINGKAKSIRLGLQRVACNTPADGWLPTRCMLASVLMRVSSDGRSRMVMWRKGGIGGKGTLPDLTRSMMMRLAGFVILAYTRPKTTTSMSKPTILCVMSNTTPTPQPPVTCLLSSQGGTTAATMSASATWYRLTTQRRLYGSIVVQN